MRFVPALRRFRKTPVAVVGHEPADLGTAFGMEASLEGDADFVSREVQRYELESERKPARGSGAESPLAWLSRRVSSP